MPDPSQAWHTASNLRLPLHRLHGVVKEPVPEHRAQGVEKASWTLCPLQRGHFVPSGSMPVAEHRPHGPAFCLYSPFPEHFRQLSTVFPRPLQRLQSTV